MRIGHTEILLCDTCSKTLDPTLHTTVPYRNGTTKRFCPGEECVAEYLGTKGEIVQRLEKQFNKVICPACQARVMALD